MLIFDRNRGITLILALASAAIAAGGCRNGEPERHHGFLARLGRDTISVESITRSGNKIVIDGVDRFPRVRRRHTEIELGPGSTIRHLVMDIHTPSEPANQRDRHVTADVTADSVHILQTDDAGKLRHDFATNGAVAMAHVPQMYSLYELYFDAALARATTEKRALGDTIQLRQFYIDREFDRFPLHHGVVRFASGNRAEIQHDWLSGTGEASFDSAGNMLNYSGARSTYLVDVARVDSVPDVRSTADRWEAEETAKGGVKQLSPRDTVRSSVGSTAITIDYSRPLARGRELLGNVIPYDRVWRTGANAATQFTTSAPITLAGIRLAAGTYTLWTVPHTNGVDLIVNGQAGQWGTQYDRSRDVGTARMQSTTLSTPIDQFTISVAAADARRGTLIMEWGPFRWAAPIEIR
ncbi:MAG TPA: DUF2911 domain-containing protein [Gemmatimonadaceae bacterium]|nr:DUF2911 domain-containing protein [Gemmatimonadaceae bacterium]